MVAQSTPGAGAGADSTTAAVSAAGAASSASQQWWTQLRSHAASTRQHLARVATDLQAASKTWKAPDFSKGLGVKLDVDMLSPAVSAVKQQYQALPDPVREVMPFAGVAAFTSFAASQVYGHQLHAAQQRYGVLRQDHDQLVTQLAQVEAQLQDSDARRTNAHLQVQMAEAVAKSTNAAAAAATAAATAASAAAAATRR